MQQTSSGFAMWSVWQPDRNLFFNSYFLERADGNLAVDPLPLSDEDAVEIERRGGVAWVVVTNRDHERATADIVQRFGAKVAAGGDAGLLHCAVDRTLGNGDAICGAIVLALEGLKTPGEIALLFRELGTVLVGDALWGKPAGALTLMPDDKLADPRRAALSLRRLLLIHPRHILVGDGAPIFDRAFDAIWACLDARDDAFVNAVNLDDLLFLRDASDPPAFQADVAEIGYLLGARRLGYRATKLPPGSSFCPLHWHTMEEELFIVWDGTPTLRTPRGSTQLRKGDLVSFGTNERSAHRISNESAAPCTLILIANDERDDVCYYPESDKVGVPGSHWALLRTTPEFDYYDGEV
jgi:uncharacterized cupin superfamily protein